MNSVIPCAERLFDPVPTHYPAVVVAGRKEGKFWPEKLQKCVGVALRPSGTYKFKGEWDGKGEEREGLWLEISKMSRYFDNVVVRKT